MERRLTTLERSQRVSRYYGDALGEVSTTSFSPVDLSGGPTVALSVPTETFVSVFFECEMHAICPFAGTAVAEASLYEAVDLGTPELLVSRSSAFGPNVPQAYQRRRTGGTGTAVMGRLFTFPVTAGKHVYSVRYAATDAGGTATFRNRRLWMIVV